MNFMLLWIDVYKRQASALQAEGHRFEPCNFHLHRFLVQKCRRGGTGRRAGLKILL